MSKPSSLRHQLLIAMPGMTDERFAHSVTYICDHSKTGAMGLVINRPIDTELDDLLEQLGLSLHASRQPYPVLQGGPVQPERGFVLHRHTTGQSWSHTVPLGQGVALTASRDVLESMANGTGPDDALVILGYAGWEAGQLEREMADNAWLTAPASAEILFETPFDQRAQVAAALLGITDLNLLAARAGHA
ncbi:MAG: YqgE/AlgH family protein [Pseudomonadales bacterium]|nr:YqgE/AlgH family protein [Pseudomonadales bacterium]